MKTSISRTQEYILIISLLIIILGLLLQSQITLQKDTPVESTVEKILAAPPIASNTYLDNYSLYVPPSFNYEVVDNTIVMENDEEIITFYLGEGVDLSSDFYEQVNIDLEQIYGTTSEQDGTTTYMYAWQYDDDHVQILLGQRDRYIAAIYPESKKTECLTDITLIFNSYTKINTTT